ncbi:Elf1-domain-containing protein [Hypoxylon sp. FL1284]|nr:Elf1-domain-containing protein [Hypoxylon sp. FL1284]
MSLQGKRKKSSRKPQGKKKSDPLPTVFTCLFCNHERSVTVELHKKNGVGELSCTVCGQAFQCGINYLSGPVDVYAEWVDAADAVAKRKREEAADDDAEGDDAAGDDVPAAGHRQAPRNSGAGRFDDEDDRHYEGEGIVGDDEEY